MKVKELEDIDGTQRATGCDEMLNVVKKCSVLSRDRSLSVSMRMSGCINTVDECEKSMNEAAVNRTECWPRNLTR